MKQAEIWWADLEPVKGSEQGKTRPLVIVIGNTMNLHFPVVIACPLSSAVKDFEGCVTVVKTKLNGLAKDSEIITFQIRTISKERLVKKLGTITVTQLNKVIGLMV
ncbi:MAG: type II toxin-antitoxin system PemK/MazF family toxin [Ferruginibacter sp.]